MTDFNDALKQIEATEANLNKLDKLWKQLEPLIPSFPGVRIDVDQPETYKEIERKFEKVRQAMPKIDGFVLENKIPSCESIYHTMSDLMRSDLAMIGPDSLNELTIAKECHGELYEQGDILSEYRFRLRGKWRQLVRNSVESICDEVDKILTGLAEQAAQLQRDAKMPEREWEELRGKSTSLRTLLGSNLGQPQRWEIFLRHVAFGMKCDYDDIMKLDWPAVRTGIMDILYGDDDPLPVDTRDIGELVRSNPKGPLVTKLQWNRLTADDFERLIYNLIREADGYDTPQWLMDVNAPDEGRDLSVTREERDPLMEPRRLRVIIQCKRKKSVAWDDVSRLREQMQLWQPPRVDRLIIATTGRFTKDVVKWVEKHNQSNEALWIELWPENHLEMLLAGKPNLIAQFKLR